jgi:hypothetical protein
MATQSDLTETLEQHPMLFDDGLFMNKQAALTYYSGNEAKLVTRRTIPLEEFRSAVQWMESRTLLKSAGGRDSQAWKKVMEKATREYVSDGAFLAAALFLNVPLNQDIESPHPLLGIKEQKGDF